MAVIVEVDLKEIYLKFNKELERELRTTIPRKLKQVILSEMNNGKSPVRGYRWTTYSKSYKDAIQSGRYAKFRKRITPVNLKLSGDLHNSLDIRFVLGSLVFEFNSTVAEYHQEGTDKMPQRKLLPGRNEKFSIKIQNVIDSSINKLVKKYFQV